MDRTATPHQQILALRQHVGEAIIGQPGLVNRLLIALLADGHLLVEGAPGLAKTTAVKVLAQGLEGDFHRIQFTPDLLPADLTGTEVYRPSDGSFHFQQGPLFHNLLLADEINRAPAKVQSALLEAMGERQITIGRETYRLPRLFLVMATQNPIDQEGTYPLPEAQLDRFLMHVRVDYPSLADEKRILDLIRTQARREVEPAAPRRPMTETSLLDLVRKRPAGLEAGIDADGHADLDLRLPGPPPLSQETLFAARRQVLDLHLSPALDDYLVQLVVATRDPGPFGEQLARWVRFGASPRATIALDRCARAHAWLAGRDYVSPQDIHAIAPDVLRHRVLLCYEAEADGITPDRFIEELMARVPVP